MIATLRVLLSRAVNRYARYLVHMAWTDNPQYLVPAEGPPPGHPERLVGDVPPSEVERVLWAQLSLR